MLIRIGRPSEPDAWWRIVGYTPGGWVRSVRGPTLAAAIEGWRKTRTMLGG